MPVRIAFCITTLDDGGAERQLTELVTRLPRDWFDPRVFVLAKSPLPPVDQLLQKMHAADVPVEFLEARHVGHAPAVSRRLTRKLQRWQPSILQCFLAHANMLGAWAAHRARVPHVFAGIRVAERRSHWHIWVQRWTNRWVTKHICVSESVADFAARKLQLPRHKLTAVPNGIDLGRFENLEPISPAKLGLAADRRAILFVGRLHPQKRPTWLLERVPALLELLPLHDLVLVGDGPLRDKLETLARQLGIQGRVHFVGWRPDVLRLLVTADLVVLTSAWEGMPNVILESMATARPVVATEVEGVVELLGSDSGGQVTPKNDPDAFVEAVARLAGNPSLARAIGQRNRQRVEEQFTVQQMVDSYTELYTSVIV